ncbi:tetratricopeptide repeat protein [Mucilaginibacter gilvus]|uniref:Tetratricopeptide repeat protein n=1 Tax=Mucilaginibacter gilvus TaxID=2305909 RepID=A0A3S3V2N3_9SPHI|nr:hypothetical protein [Mucilaginibacter gilvus]RWY54162.1 hypothetical protein EPL05_08960 [Mucilaginibacter gilvus]
MNTYYTIEEKYLHAVDKLYFNTPRGLKMLSAIIADDPLYARAHYQIGKIYYRDLKDYQTAGYHFKTCMELEPLFPDNYFEYLSLVVFLDMARQVEVVSAKALITPGVSISEIHELLGLYAEKSRQYAKALEAYRNAYMEATIKEQRDNSEEAIDRVKEKMQQSFAYQYTLSG